MKIEIFSAGCPLCRKLVHRIQSAASPADEVKVLDMHSLPVAQRAQSLGIAHVPAVFIDGEACDWDGESRRREPALKSET